MNRMTFEALSRRRFIVSGISSLFVVAACEAAESNDGNDASSEGQDSADGKADNPGYTINSNRLQGYADKISVAQGARITFMISAPGNFNVSFIRCGTTDVTVGQLQNIEGTLQQAPANAAKVGAGYGPTFGFDVPEDWPSGLYAADLTLGAQRFAIPFIVRQAAPGSTARMAVVMSTFTWEAYNKWGQASFYNYALNDGEGVTMNEDGFQVSPFVSMNRPNPFEGDPLRGWRARGERGILRWLETQGYEHAVLADEDMHREPAILQSYTTVILNAHPEYYSDNMRRALQEFLDAGGNLAYLGGNGVYWRITVADRQLECRKEMDITARLHTQPEVSGTLGGRWRELGQPESALLGIEFDVEWYLATHGRQYTPYVVKQPDHFAFANTNLQEGDLFGTPGRTLWGDDADGASGYEIDRVTEHSPDNIVVLAEATGEPAAAQMTYYDHPGGGGVFSAGSISFTMGIDLDDDRLGAVLRNVLDRFVADTGP